MEAKEVKKKKKRKKIFLLCYLPYSYFNPIQSAKGSTTINSVIGPKFYLLKDLGL